MRYLSADLVFPVHIPPVSEGILVIDTEGKIIDLLDPVKNEIPSSLPIERFNGILCPGFVNTHCHLELSHLKGKLSQKKGLPEFISEMVEKRNGNDEEIIHAMTQADNEMFSEGIVAVGDISNSAISSIIKKKSNIYYHTFVELFDISSDRAEKVFNDGIVLQKVFSENGLIASIVPHSLYTVSDRLMKLICANTEKSKSIFSIHNQETSGENEMFEKGTGALIDKMQKLTSAFSNWKPSGKSSLATFIDRFNPTFSVQLVHNTFTRLFDIQLMLRKNSGVYWCLCINANLFIENVSPDIPMLTNEKCLVTIGTDSYASNLSLSVLDELRMIATKYPKIALEEMLTWATINGADFLRISNKYGSFEKGKKPGINHISGIDIKELKLKNESKLLKLL